MLNKATWYVRDARLDLGCETFLLNVNGFPKLLWTKVDWHLTVVHDFYILLCLSSSSSLSSSLSSAAVAAAFRALMGFHISEDHNFETTREPQILQVICCLVLCSSPIYNEISTHCFPIQHFPTNILHFFSPCSL